LTRAKDSGLKAIVLRSPAPVVTVLLVVTVTVSEGPGVLGPDSELELTRNLNREDRHGHGGFFGLNEPPAVRPTRTAATVRPDPLNPLFQLSSIWILGRYEFIVLTMNS
jgi:hypothetical protein